MEDHFLSQINQIESTNPEFPTSEIPEDSLIANSYQIATINTSDYAETERVERNRKASMAGEHESKPTYRNPLCDEERVEQGERIRKVIKTDKYRYIGETWNNFRDGFGLCYYTNGEIHIGQWRRNTKEGYGKTLYTDGSIFQGEMRNNKFDGFCEKITKDSVIVGSVSEGFFIEEVIIKYNNKTIETKIDSNLIKKIYNETAYFVGDEKLGINTNSNGICAGYLTNNRLNGYGEIYKDETKFFGNFVEDKRNGMSIEFTKDDKVLIGDYRDDFKNGAFFIINKTAFKMEIHQLGFKTKTVEKYDNCKKYLSLNYPEFSYMLKVNYKQLIDKFSPVDAVNI
jgi:hypothetical protein